MAASDRLRRSRHAALVAVVCAIALVDCGEFVRTNPFDPNVPVTLRIEGPTQTVAQFDTVRFTVTTSPEYDHDPAVWSVTSGFLEKLDENGTFRAPRIGVYSGPVQVTARIGTRSTFTSLQVTYQPASFRMFSCDDSSRTIGISSLDATANACGTAYDARGAVLNTYGPPPVSLVATSLDPSTVTIGLQPAQVRSVRNGATKVVYSWNGRADTLSVSVRQKVASLKVTPAACGDINAPLRMTLGSTLQLSLGPEAYDSTGHPVTDDVAVQAALSLARWYSSRGYVTVSADGFVTPYFAGYEILGYTLPRSQYTINSGGGCYLVIE
jgi:hypothetical protein